MVTQYFSPKEVARAIGVSESSLKRWVDKGVIRASKTAGGHRRLHLDAILEYVRTTGRQIADPVAISLPDGVGKEPDMSLDGAVEPFSQCLLTGDELGARRIVIDLYVHGHGVAEICDRLIAPAFGKVGNLWKCGDVEVYEERRACELCQRVVHELRRAVGAGDNTGPVAMGGTLDGDPYTIASGLVEVVLCSAGWRASSLGNMLPFDTIRKAIIENQPRLFWISVTSIRDEDRFSADFNLLFDIAQSMNTALVVGGQALTIDVRQRIRYSNFSDDFRQMEAYAKSIR